MFDDDDDARAVGFRVMAQVHNQPDVRLENGLPSYADARILEQWMEKRLGIKDRPVPDEASG
jgi:hypothetical protein